VSKVFLLAVAGLVGAAAGVRGLLARGAITVDVGIGRTLRPLGPLMVLIAAPREVVFDVVASPYLGRTPRALETKLKVLERGEDRWEAAVRSSLEAVKAEAERRAVRTRPA
jgi:hypothetical protein